MAADVTLGQNSAQAPASSGSLEDTKKLAYFPFIEGLRGLGAFYVMTAHIYDHLFRLPGAPFPALQRAAGIFQYGHFSIAIFIVISGFCLGAPVAKRRAAKFDTVRFLRRRAQRLLPAYFLALAGAVVIIFLEHGLLGMHLSLRHTLLAIGLHIALLQNLFPQFIYSVDAPMWTISLECQIYLVFAFVLVPIWKRFGPIAQLGAALTLGLLPEILAHGRLDYTAPWFIALFGMGVAAADLTRIMGRSRRWPLATIVVTVIGVGAMLRTGDPGWQVGLLIGASVALFLGCCAAGYFPRAVRFLSLAPIAGLGAFSYSLYLVHGPIVGLTGLTLTHFHAPGAIWLVAYAVQIPLALLIAYGVYLLAERPFMSATLRGGIDATARTRVTVPVIEIGSPLRTESREIRR